METETVCPPLAPTWKVRLWAALAVASVPVPLAGEQVLVVELGGLGDAVDAVDGLADGGLVGGGGGGVVRACVGGVQDELADVHQERLCLVEGALGGP